LLIEIRRLRAENALFRVAGDEMAYAVQEHFEDAFRRWKILTLSVPNRKLPKPDLEPEKG
jgi:hypothetical protein